MPPPFKTHVGLLLIVAATAAAAAPSHQQNERNHQRQLETSERSGPTASNESLQQLLRATLAAGKQQQPVASTTQRARGQQTAPTTQAKPAADVDSVAAAKVEIGCDKLALLVLAQRALNLTVSASATAKLLECQRRLAATHDVVAAAADQQEPDETVRRFEATQQLPPAPPQPLRNATLNEGNKFIVAVQRTGGRQGQGGAGLHFGAKVSISVLLGTIGLVALATLVEIRSLKCCDSARECRTAAAAAAAKAAEQTPHSKRRELRDYRSLSFSSSCSSQLCSSSGGSVASSSLASILSKPTPEPPPPPQQQQQRQTGATASYANLLKQLLFAFSLRQSARQIFELAAPEVAAGGERGSGREQKCKCGCSLISTRPAQPVARQPLGPLPHRSRVSSFSSGGSESSALAAPTSAGSANSGAAATLNAAEDEHEEDSSDSCAPSESDAEAAHSAKTRCAIDTRYTGLDQPNCRREQARGQPNSIDSLHGLRFLSMIWVIIVHSYNFALRWTLFAQANPIDEIYKSLPSQVLANGSFACDTFFFAAGFLLPYLAIPAADEETTRPQNRPGNGAPNGTDCKRVGCAGHLLREAPLVGKEAAESEVPAECKLADNNHYPNNNNNNGSYCANLQEAAPSIHVTQPQRKRTQNQKFLEQAFGAQQFDERQEKSVDFPLGKVVGNLVHRYVRMMPLMMAIIGLSATLLRYLGEGPVWSDSTLMYDKWCRKNWWVNALFLHNFVNRENMCLSHSWYSAVDIQLFLVGQLILFALFKSKKLGLALICGLLLGSQLITGLLTLVHKLPAVPLVASVSEQTMNLYYGEIYIKPYCRASPYLVGMLLAYLMRTTSLGCLKLKQWQVWLGWTGCLATIGAILFAMQPAMNGHPLGQLEAALYSSLSRPLWACATGWMIFACMTKHGGPIGYLLSARCFVPLSRLTYPAFLIHPIVMAVFYGSRQSSLHFSHYLMLYLIIGNIVITYASAFLLAALFELPLLSAERAIKSFLLETRAAKTRAQGPNHHLLAEETLNPK